MLAIADVQLDHGIVEVEVDGALRHVKQLGDFPGGFTVRCPAQTLGFARGQFLQGFVVGRCRDAPHGFMHVTGQQLHVRQGMPGDFACNDVVAIQREAQDAELAVWAVDGHADPGLEAECGCFLHDLGTTRIPLVRQRMPFDGHDVLAAIKHRRIAEGVAIFPIVVEPGVRVTLEHDHPRLGELSGNSQGIDKEIEAQLRAVCAAERSDVVDAGGGRKAPQLILKAMGIDGEAPEN